MSIPFQRIREVRRARSDEAEAIAALAADAAASGAFFGKPGPFPDGGAVLEFLAKDDRIIYVAAPVGQVPLGVVAVEPVAPVFAGAPLCATLLWVTRERRREGWGSRLAEQALIWARRRGAEALAFARPAPRADGAMASDALAQTHGWRLDERHAVAEIRA